MSTTNKTPFVAGSAKIVVKFTAKWCGPCKRIQPEFEDLAEDYASCGVTFFCFDIEDDIADQSNDEILEAYPCISEVYPKTITSIPRFSFFKDGKHIQTMAWDRKAMVTLLEKEFTDEPVVTFEDFKAKMKGEPLIKSLDSLAIQEEGEEESDLEVDFSEDREVEKLEDATETTLERREESKPKEDAVDLSAEISGVSESEDSDGEREE